MHVFLLGVVFSVFNVYFVCVGLLIFLCIIICLCVSVFVVCVQFSNVCLFLLLKCFFLKHFYLY